MGLQAQSPGDGLFILKVELSGIQLLVQQRIFIIGGLVVYRLESSMVLVPAPLLAGFVVGE